MVRTFVLLYQTSSVTRTAEALFISQPSVSYTLGKLRTLFKDELFVRDSAGMQPTELAEELYPKLRESLRYIDEAMSGATEFDPATSQHTFRLIMTDLGEVGLLPLILRNLQAAAPSITVEILPFNASTARKSLVVGSVDAAICTPRLDGPDLIRDLIFTQPYVGICAKAHPRIHDRPTLTEFLAERHITVNASIGHDQVEDVVRELGYEKDIAVRLSRFSAMPDLLSQTEYLSIVPRQIADVFAQRGTIKTFELPFDVPAGNISLYTHARALLSPAADWFRNSIRDLLRASL